MPAVQSLFLTARKIKIPRNSNNRAVIRPLRVSTKSPLSWRKCRSPKIQWIFGLHSTPANTTHAPLKTALQAVFAYKEFFCCTCQQKNRNAADRRQKYKKQVNQLTEIRPKGRILPFFGREITCVILHIKKLKNSAKSGTIIIIQTKRGGGEVYGHEKMAGRGI